MIMTILRMNIQNMLSRMFSRSRSAKSGAGRKILIAFLIVYIVGVFFSMFYTMFAKISTPMASIGLGWLYFAVMGIVSFGLCFIGSVFMAQAQIFDAKDNELLLSMPIKPSVILAGRLVSLLLLEYLFEAFVVLPAGIAWCLHEPVTAVGTVFFLVAVLLLPFMVLALTCLFAWLIALITSHMRNKNMVTFILSLMFFALYFLGFSRMQQYMTALIAHGTEIGAAVQRSVFPAYHMGVAIADGKVLSLLIFAVCAVVPFLLVCALLSWNFIRIATANKGAAKIKYREKALRVSGVRTALIKKELRHFVSNPMYILNASLGCAFMFALAVLVIVKRSLFIEIAGQTGGISPAALACAAICALAATNFISAPSISIEGKNLWITRSLPVRSGDILMAKADMHILICGTSSVISAAVCAVFLNATAVQAALLLTVPLSLTAFAAYLGVAVNLQFPKFDWISELQPIKQGMSVMICMFGTMAVVAALIILYIYVASIVLGIEAYLAVCLVIFSITAGLLRRYLKNGGSRRFESLVD